MPTRSKKLRRKHKKPENRLNKATQLKPSLRTLAQSSLCQLQKMFSSQVLCEISEESLFPHSCLFSSWETIRLSRLSMPCSTHLPSSSVEWQHLWVVASSLTSSRRKATGPKQSFAWQAVPSPSLWSPSVHWRQETSIYLCWVMPWCFWSLVPIPARQSRWSRTQRLKTSKAMSYPYTSSQSHCHRPSHQRSSDILQAASVRSKIQLFMAHWSPLSSRSATWAPCHSGTEPDDTTKSSWIRRTRRTHD